MNILSLIFRPIVFLLTYVINTKVNKIIYSKSGWGWKRDRNTMRKSYVDYVRFLDIERAIKSDVR
jgi:hypothetical protein